MTEYKHTVVVAPDATKELIDHLTSLGLSVEKLDIPKVELVPSERGELLGFRFIDSPLRIQTSRPDIPQNQRVRTDPSRSVREAWNRRVDEKKRLKKVGRDSS